MVARRSKSIWIILDPLDGPHLFTSEKSAINTFKQWEKEAQDESWDSFWDMSEPTEYIIKDKDGKKRR